MKRFLLFLNLVALLVTGCATPAPQTEKAIAYVAGEYEPDYNSRFGAIYITHDFHFILNVRIHGQFARAIGRVIAGPCQASGDAPRWIELLPDAPYVRWAIPSRLYLTQRDSYQCLATKPFAPKFWHGGPPSGYDYFCDVTDAFTPSTLKAVLKEYSPSSRENRPPK
ncbi:MAG: hypothetical protein QM796_08930 [Chthoniobacteraceae bacterium]